MKTTFLLVPSLLLAGCAHSTTPTVVATATPIPNEANAKKFGEWMSEIYTNPLAAKVDYPKGGVYSFVANGTSQFPGSDKPHADAEIEETGVDPRPYVNVFFWSKNKTDKPVAAAKCYLTPEASVIMAHYDKAKTYKITGVYANFESDARTGDWLVFEKCAALCR